jgi:hypothetical protein
VPRTANAPTIATHVHLDRVPNAANATLANVNRTKVPAKTLTEPKMKSML